MPKHGFYAFALVILTYGCASATDAQTIHDDDRGIVMETTAVETEPPEPLPVEETEEVAPIANDEVVLVREMLQRTEREARPQMPSSGLPEADPTFVAAIKRELSVNLPNGSTAPVRHCLTAGPRMNGGDRWQRCQRRVTLFAQYFQAAGAEHDVDPWVLAAMAQRESGFAPLASGAAGEYGIMQLHPRGVGRRSNYVSSARFRERCQYVPGACQEEVISIGADLLGRAFRQCGTIEQALGAYNTGRCGGNEGYTRRVFRVLERMRAPIVDEG